MNTWTRFDVSGEACVLPSTETVVNLVGIASAEAFGAAIAKNGALLLPSSIPSAEAFGTPSLNPVIFPASIPSEESFGAPSLTPAVSPASIASGEAFGTAVITHTIAPASIPSDEAFGTAVIT